MARSIKATTGVEALSTFRRLIAPEDIIEAACRLGAIQRQRKVDLPALVEATIAAVLPVNGTQTTAFANYIALTGQRLAPSAFYDRYSDKFCDLMREVAGHAICAVREAAPKDRRVDDFGVLLKEFSDVQVVDSTLLTLRKLALSWATPSAKLKWHAVISLEDCLPVSGRFTSRSVGDVAGTPEGALSPGTLTLMDLGYMKFEHLKTAAENGAFFIMRLRDDISPLITDVRLGASEPSSAIGLHLNEALQRGALHLGRGPVDLDVVLKKAGFEPLKLRLVGVKAPQPDLNYHWYLTNVDPEVLDPRDVATAYRLRWTIELFFKQLKTGTALRAIQATRKSAVLSLFYAKVIALCLSRLLEFSLDAKNGRNATTQLALVLAVTRCAPLLLSAMMMSRGVTLPQLEERLLLIAEVIAKSRNQRRERTRRRREKSLGAR